MHRVVLAAVVLGALVGCNNDVHFSDAVGSEMVFGIEQSLGADGTTQTTVGYEYLDVLNQGWSAVGLVNRSESCWAEQLDDRIGSANVSTGGVATFTGGALPANGIAVVANNPDLTLRAPAWTAGGAPLTFQANGFAMPGITPVTIYAPATTLTVTSPADPAADVAFTAPVYGRQSYPQQDDPTLTLTWNVDPETAGPRENVVASLTAVPANAPNSRGVELRCFWDRQAGTGTFPLDLVSRFVTLVNGSSATAFTGKLLLATHRQVTILADGGWTVYVVATADQRQQSFTLTPLIKN